MGKAVLGTCDYPDCNAVGVEMTSVQILLDDVEWVGDLCENHSAPLRDLIQAMKGRKRPESRNRVYTIEEIEAMKKELDS